MTIAYTNELHRQNAEFSIRIAKTVGSIMHNLLHPKSVIDLGCGHGHWLREFQDFGVKEVRGVDGDYVRTEDLVIPPESFTPFDLNQPFPVERRYDLAMSIEVIEHLRPTITSHFIDSLCALSDVVIFSAAIPSQPGHHHINANWPNYWACEFRRHGYVALDFIRPQIWHREDLLLCHRQNILVFTHKELAEQEPWRHLSRMNCLTLIDMDVLKELLGVRESGKRLLRRVFGMRR